MSKVAWLGVFAALVTVPTAAAKAGDEQRVTFDSLLQEMVDRDALARWPAPEYTCLQFSSYDRLSKPGSQEIPQAWFANGDAGNFLRIEDVAARGDQPARREWVMADMTGPGAIVRLWTPNPKGTLRIYIDDEADRPNGTPAIEGPMSAILDGTWRIKAPLSQSAARGWNCYLPIPYARRCKVTTDAGDGVYYHVNYRRYAQGTDVQSFRTADLDSSADRIEHTRTALAESVERRPIEPPGRMISMLRGGSKTAIVGSGQPGAIRRMSVSVSAVDAERVLRTVCIAAKFDGEQTIWCPLGDFFGSGIGCNRIGDWYRAAEAGSDRCTFTCWWAMPFKESATITFTNLGDMEAKVLWSFEAGPWTWDDRSMYFHAGWVQEHPIHTAKGAGTRDWNYLEATGRGVYVGDALAIVNPVAEWWGEGDEKIFVDGESFPSHFGTGTEDYYGFGWCTPEVFRGPFVSQPRVDGAGKNNWGHTTVTRVRSLDAIPFTQQLKFDMEVWHWAECDVGYAATTYWYALPGSTSNRGAAATEARRGVIKPAPLPPPFRIEGALECEAMEVAACSEGLRGLIGSQDMQGFARKAWSGDAHLWVRARKAGDFVELNVPAPGSEPRQLTLYATKSWDYGIVRVMVNGRRAGDDLDLFSGGQGICTATGPIDLGVFEPRDGKFTLRFEVVGGNEKALGNKSFFGLDAVTVTPAAQR